MISARAPFVAALFASPLLALVVLAACSSSSSATSSGSPGVDAADDGPAAQGDGGAASDAPNDRTTTDAPPSTCDSACKTTSLVADFGGKKRTLVRAQFGTQQGDAGAQLHTESHLGGAPACPTPASPTPDYTLIVSAVPRGAAGRKLTERAGVSGAFFDFKGDLGLPPLTKAITMNVTVVGEDPATPPAWVALDVTAGFREGNVTGHLYAEYCASLSQ